MTINSIPQLLMIIALLAAAFGWGVTMNKKQDKASCAVNNAELYKLIRDMTEQMSGMKIEMAKLNEKVISLEKQVDVLNRIELIIERQHEPKRISKS